MSKLNTVEKKKNYTNPTTLLHRVLRLVRLQLPETPHFLESQWVPGGGRRAGPTKQEGRVGYDRCGVEDKHR